MDNQVVNIQNQLQNLGERLDQAADFVAFLNNAIHELDLMNDDLDSDWDSDEDLDEEWVDESEADSGYESMEEILIEIDD